MIQKFPLNVIASDKKTTSNHQMIKKINNYKNISFSTIKKFQKRERKFIQG